eukprot:CAMPEP_0170552722 /NCGR_PEP_ID=MMETSP0211-20121228/10605_1 /TAXON_ID=311385 /ORGANISM="Pseudokeronopsis sp., Strain OXSARD2" /LENGTH=94 /DNA_ID=CAMNT_0010860641 /DNA_START=571 /DNA_END=855 /DNA_ORIENTATION=-
MGAEMMSLNNRNAVQRQILEQLEDQKEGRLMVENEKQKRMMKRTREHGQILMTIDNLYRKCKARKDLQTTKDKKQTDSPKNFDNMVLSGDNAVS